MKSPFLSKKIMLVAERRNFLIARVAAQRDDFVSAYAPIRSALGYVDYGINAVRTAGRHPWLVGGIAALLVIIAPKRWKILLIENMLPAGILLLRKYFVKK